MASTPTRPKRQSPFVSTSQPHLFPGLFSTGNFNLDVILNYGLAGVFWLVVGAILARVIGR